MGGIWPSYPLAEGPLSFKQAENDPVVNDYAGAMALKDREEQLWRMWRECAEGHLSRKSTLHRQGNLPMELFCKKYPEWSLGDIQNLKQVGLTLSSPHPEEGKTPLSFPGFFFFFFFFFWADHLANLDTVAGRCLAVLT